ncbi:MAG: RluA family pseudouridine synthase [Candidatus Omnitrophota bacterium]|nr:RluA family pseudouridine synthase [Candidatus Omnitrophota bacterium]
MKDPFEIIFEDEYVVVLNKIAKILVQPSPKKEKLTLSSLLAKKLNEKVYPCHRLDRETSGLIIYAKSNSVQKKIMDQFRRGEVRKKYIAFVKGKMKKRSGEIENYILDKEGAKFGEKAKKAKTRYRVLGESDEFSVVELVPLTGRTNQLRIQFAKLGHPILGERRYAFRRDFPIDFKRLALHSFFVSFIHPISRDRVNLEIEMAQDMGEFLRDLSV